MVDVCVVAEGFGFEASISVRDITAQSETFVLYTEPIIVCTCTY